MVDSARATKMRSHVFQGLVALLWGAGLCASVWAQVDAGSEPIVLMAGRSAVVRAPWPTIRVAVTDPNVANVQVLTREQVLVQGLKVGTTDLILWSADEQQKTWQRQVVVRFDTDNIQGSLRRLFPTAAQLTATTSGDVLLVQGLLRSADQAAQLKDFLEKAKVPYVNMTSVAGVQQVQLQVRVAEVSRVAIRQLGVNAVGTNKDFFFGQKVGGVSPSIDIGPAGDLQSLAWSTPSEGITAGSSVTLFAGFPNSDFEVYLQALAENQYMRVLANPTLVALSGEEAKFLAGGEFPIPVPQNSGTGGQTITITYKQFGVLLSFRPVVLGDNGIRLRAVQEVSELSETGALVIQGYSVPGLTTRRAEATMELKSGQSFAMAGLLRSSDAAVSSRIPGLGDLPVIGELFRSVRYKNEETELVILVTASLVEPMSVGQAPPLPGVAHQIPDDWELYLEGRLEGKEPAKIDPVSQQWLRDMGLAGLVGPGAWDTYEGQSHAEAAGATKAPKIAGEAAGPSAGRE
jgi:pilus assembly protein CpaC